MPNAVRRVLSVVLLPLRLFGYADDLVKLWSIKDTILTAATTLVTTGIGTAFASAGQYPWYVTAPLVTGALLFGLWGAISVIGFFRNRSLKAQKARSALSEHPPEHSQPRRSIVAEGRATYQDEGSTWYGRSGEDIHLSDDAQAATKGSEFGKLWLPEQPPPDCEVSSSLIPIAAYDK